MSRFVYKGNYSLYHSGQWARKHFTPVGGALAGIMFVTAVLGLNVYGNELYQILTLMLAMMCVAVIWGLFFKAELEIKRILPKFATVGERLRYPIEIHNRMAKKWTGLYLEENFGDPRPTLEAFLAAKEPDEDNRNAWDRKVMYHRWAWMLNRNRRGKAEEMELPLLQGHGKTTVTAELMPLRRGYLELTGITVKRPGPLGLYRGVKEIQLNQRLLVLPKRYALPKLRLPGSRRYHSGGVSLSTSVGNSTEFVSLRDYRPGDPLKHIHWKSWAKTEKLIIKEYQDEFFVRHALILDTFIQNIDRDAFEEAVSTAASFVLTVRQQEALLDLMFVEDQAYAFSSGRGLGYAENMLEVLACITGTTAADQSMFTLETLVMKYATLLSGCICIFLDWDRERKTFVSRLKARGVPVKVLVVNGTITDYRPDEGDPMKNDRDNFHILTPGKMEEGLAKL